MVELDVPSIHGPSMRAPAFLLLTALAGCGGSTLGLEASCVAAVNVGGIDFTGGGLPSVPPDQVGAVHAEVRVHTGCQDQGSTTKEALEWAPGTSNFLPVGTRIHRVDGFSAMERLTYWSDTVDEWLSLIPLTRD